MKYFFLLFPLLFGLIPVQAPRDPGRNDLPEYEILGRARYGIRLEYRINVQGRLGPKELSRIICNIVKDDGIDKETFNMIFYDDLPFNFTSRQEYFAFFASYGSRRPRGMRYAFYNDRKVVRWEKFNFDHETDCDCRSRPTRDE